MGFLKWIKGQEGDPACSSIDTERLTGATINVHFRAEIQDKGGDGDCQRDASVALSQQLFDGLSPNEVYTENHDINGKRYTEETRRDEGLTVDWFIDTHSDRIWIRVPTSSYLDYCEKLSFKDVVQYWGEGYKPNSMTGEWIFDSHKQAVVYEILPCEK